MEFIALFFVAKPQNILMVGTIFFIIYFILQFIVKANRLHPRPLLILSIVWGMYAIWELLVQVETPEANIRIDLLIIWPLLAILSIWKLVRVFR